MNRFLFLLLLGWYKRKHIIAYFSLFVCFCFENNQLRKQPKRSSSISIVFIILISSIFVVVGMKKFFVVVERQN